MTKLKYYLGNIYGDFEVIKDLGHKFATAKSSRKMRFVIAKCAKCLLEFEITINNLSHLSENNCKQKHQSRNKLKVSEDWTRLRWIREKMLQRCYTEKNSGYERYGKQGITVCEDWIKSLDNFYNWAIENGYKDNLTIDRINSSGNYEPNNCRWVSTKEQTRNRRNVISIEKVKQIKILLEKGYVNRIIAEMVCTSKSRVDDISSGKTWIDI